jgi:seryl-tRNA(Sec) selenium transferase
MAGTVPNDPAGLEAVLADRLEAEGALLAASLAAATVWAAAGLLGPGDKGGRVVLPLAHLARLDGAPLTELIRLAGGAVTTLGTVRDCPETALERALGEAPAAAALVVDPELPEVLPPARFLWLCRQARVPALILDPASGRWTAWADGGAALVVLDGRALLGVEAGILAGTAEAIAACRAAEAPSAAFRAPTGPARRATGALVAGE